MAQHSDRGRGPSERAGSSRTARPWGVLAIVLGFLLSAGVVWQSSQAAFTANVSNPGNSFTAGKVSVTSTGSGSATFSVTGLKPGSSGSQCVDVTYTGNIAASVKMYGANYVNTDASAGAGQLAAVITLTISTGAGANCAAPGAQTQIYSGSLHTFGTTITTFGTGIGTFTPSTNGTIKPYTVAYSVGNDNTAQGDIGQVDFVWESQA